MPALLLYNAGVSCNSAQVRNMTKVAIKINAVKLPSQPNNCWSAAPAMGEIDMNKPLALVITMRMMLRCLPL